MFSVRYTETADVCFAVLTPEQRRDVIHIVARLQINPWIDPPVKVALPALGAMYILYIDHRDRWALYHHDNALITDVGVGIGDPYVDVPTSE